MSTRRGFTLIELVIALVLSAILGGAVIKILLTTGRFYQKDSAIRSARTIARSPLGLIETELMAVEPSGGIVAADSFQLTVRSGYATGLLCGIASGVATISLLPSDSLMTASAGFSGYAWRAGTGSWTYVDGGAPPATGSAAICSAAGIITLAGGRVIALSPAPPALTAVGTPVLLHQRVTYRFAPSALMPGRRALWRDVATGNVSEELAAPFEATARFRFFTGASDTSRAVPAAPLSANRGVELVLDGASERPPYGGGVPETSGVTTGIFFRKRGAR